MTKQLLALAVLSVATGCSMQQSATQASANDHRPWMNRNLPPEQRAKLLVKQMTLDEKISQIHMLDQKEHPREVAGIPRLGVPIFKITNGPAGAGPGDAKPTQPATALPAAIALSASWDPELAKTWGHIAGAEVRDRGEHLIEGPGVNITRVPQNGRNFEYFGEDPYLSGQLGAAEIQALQSEKVIAEVKHYAANNQETNRKTVNEVIDERTLREIYLPAFEASIIDGHAGAVMAAYPSVNGNFCSENPHLLQDILRDTWHFTGFVQSDYTGTHSADRGAKAGLDLSMKADHYANEMKQAVLNHTVPESLVDKMVLRRFTKMFEFGMFDEPRNPTPIPAPQDGAFARTNADQGAVLLKNDNNTLPLNPTQLHSIALIGPQAVKANTGGRGSSQVKPLYTVNPLDGLKSHLPDNVKVTLNDGQDIPAAADLAKSADIAIVMVGNQDSEGKDRPNLSLPKYQDDLVSAIAAANPHTIVVLKTGGPVLMPWVEKAPAILEAWYPGEEDGNVVADLLFGLANPSGKLTMTFPREEKQTPAHTPEQWPGIGDKNNSTATYSEKLEVGYRWYDAQNADPLFPFGFGLSYTTFNIANLHATPQSVSVDVTNSGPREGAEVVQVYVAAPQSAGEPPKQLKGFQKVSLQPNETRHLTIPLDPRAYSIWDTTKNAWTQIPGHYQILVGDSSRNLPLKTEIDIH
ncbi:MAG: glycoside hydrolase family 3 C-terminal domain-containing protein [Phycisphaerae bacterium]